MEKYIITMEKFNAPGFPKGPKRLFKNGPYKSEDVERELNSLKNEYLNEGYTCIKDRCGNDIFLPESSKSEEDYHIFFIIE